MWDDKERKKEKGITLIALVITIIVLLILAGVTIAMLTGKNGILGQANEAKEKTQQATIEEQKKLAQTEANLNLEEKAYKDKNDKTIAIPAGMAVSSIEGENEINKGLVAIDKNGNEWVWLEVPKNVTQNASTDLEIETVLQNYAKDYRESDWSDTWYEGCGLTETEYGNLKSKMLQSIKTKGGFWVGRYETGANTFTSNDDNGARTPVIQANQYPYNYVNCTKAQELSSRLGPNTTCSTSLLFGIQWDLMKKQIEESKMKTQAEMKIDSVTWGNYKNSTFEINRGKYSIDKGVTWNTYLEDAMNYIEKSIKLKNQYVLITTGASEQNKAFNIYDLAGNESEWTLEKSSITGRPSTTRGGDYYNNGEVKPSSSRADNSRLGSIFSFSFRIALYE